MTALHEMRLSDMAGMEFDCSCGRRHSVGIKWVISGGGALKQTPDIVRKLNYDRVFLLADNNTYKVAGSKVEEDLKKFVSDLTTFVFQAEKTLVPNETAVGRVIMEIEPGTTLIVAVGSGTINDLARYAGYRLGIPFIIAGTAPSMDGYASVVSPLIINGFKKTYNAIYPEAVITDTDILVNAPLHMLQSGFGDVLGKLTALCDWELARRIEGEYHCEAIANVVSQALKRCIDNVGGIKTRDPKAIEYITEGLLLAGVAMGLAGVSRPASGAEHTIAHYWEMDAVAKGEEHLLHGTLVGVGTVVVSHIYEFLADKLPEGIVGPAPETVIRLLTEVGAPVSPKAAGVDRELFKRSVLLAKNMRKKYTILDRANDLGMLEGIADHLTNMFY